MHCTTCRQGFTRKSEQFMVWFSFWTYFMSSLIFFSFDMTILIWYFSCLVCTKTKTDQPDLFEIFETCFKIDYILSMCSKIWFESYMCYTNENNLLHLKTEICSSCNVCSKLKKKVKRMRFSVKIFVKTKNFVQSVKQQKANLRL